MGLGIELREEDVAQEFKQLPHVDQEDMLVEDMKAMRVRLCAVTLARAVAAALAKRAACTASLPMTLTIRATASSQDAACCEWLLVDESSSPAQSQLMPGLSEACITEQFDWRKVERHPSFQEALKQQELTCASCELAGRSAFQLTVVLLSSSCSNSHS